MASDVSRWEVNQIKELADRLLNTADEAEHADLSRRESIILYLEEDFAELKKLINRMKTDS